MAKCIKSITAGLLHLEILGKVPDSSGQLPTWQTTGTHFARSAVLQSEVLLERVGADSGD